MDQKALMNYLQTGEAPVKATVTVIEKATVNPVDAVIAHLCATVMLAKDLHYRARGKAFYAIHLLADLVWAARSEIDELLEVYYLGERKTPPPLMSAYQAYAVNVVRNLLDNGIGVTSDFDGEFGEDQLLQALNIVCSETAELVEAAKKLPLRSGTSAVLDEVSKKALQNAGLLTRTETPAPATVTPTPEPVSPDPADVVL